MSVCMTDGVLVAQVACAKKAEPIKMPFGTDLRTVGALRHDALDASAHCRHQEIRTE